MRELRKIIIGLLAVLPLGFWLLFLLYPESEIWRSLDNRIWEGNIIATFLSTITITIVFMILAITNKNLDRDKKSMWFVVFFALSAFILPVYWYLYIFKDVENLEEYILTDEIEFEKVEPEVCEENDNTD